MLCDQDFALQSGELTRPSSADLPLGVELLAGGVCPLEDDVRQLRPRGEGVTYQVLAAVPACSDGQYST